MFRCGQGVVFNWLRLA